MKGFVYVLVVFIAVVCVTANEIKKLINECETETGVTDEILKDQMHEAKSQNVKCFFACFLKKIGSMANGKMDSDKSLENLLKWNPNLDEEEKNKIKECATKANEKEAECDVGGEFRNCIDSIMHKERVTTIPAE